MKAPIQLQAAAGLRFVENMGQWTKAVRFSARTDIGTLFFTANGFWIVAIPRGKAAGTPTPPDPMRRRQAPELGKGVAIQVTLRKARTSAKVVGSVRAPSVTSFFKGRNPNDWRADVPVWDTITYNDIAPGVSLKISSVGRQLTMRWLVDDPKALSGIEWSFRGCTNVKLATLNDKPSDRDYLPWGLTLLTPVGAIALNLPAPGVDAPGRPKVARRGDSTVVVSMPVGAGRAIRPWPHDVALPTIAEPLLREGLDYSTFLGGGDIDWMNSMAADDHGHCVVTGETWSPRLPRTPGVFTAGRLYGGLTDAFVAKLDTRASGPASMVYLAYLGGSDWDGGNAIALDRAGCAYVTGFTRSRDFPYPLATVDYKSRGTNVFVTKVATDGRSLPYSFVFGGEGDDEAYAVAVDDAGCAYVGGQTSSPRDFPQVNPSQAGYGGGDGDGFVCKLNPAGDTILYSSFLGGEDYDMVLDLALDQARGIYVTGLTRSRNFPTSEAAFQARWPATDGVAYCAFVAKIDPDARLTTYSTYLSGPGLSVGHGIAVGQDGSACVVGSVWGTGFPTTDKAFQRVAPTPAPPRGLTDDNEFNLFLSRVSPDGRSLLYSTYLGGSRADGGGSRIGGGIAVGPRQRVYLTGVTLSPDFPVTEDSAVDPDFGSDEYSQAILCVINTEAATGPQSLLYSSFLGGSRPDRGNDIAVDRAGRVTIAGETYSWDFPTSDSAFQRSIAVGPDGFVTCFVPAMG